MAETKCGSAAGLMAAIKRGDVKEVTSDDGVTLYFFPKKSFGSLQTFGTRQDAGRTKEIDQSGFDAVAAFVENMSWTVKTSQKCLEASTAHLR